MQQTILKNKNNIAFLTGILIAFAFLGHWLFKLETLAVWLLVVSSIIGLAPIAIQAFQALKLKIISIDLLVTIAVSGAFLIKNFEESAIVTFLFLFGAYLEQRTLNKTRSAIKALTEMAPESALRLNEAGEFEEIDVDDVDVDDILLVKTGAKIPVDGYVTIGEGSINEASISGESLPVAKEKGSYVYAGTILDNGTLQIQASKVGEDTTFGKIIELVEEAQDSKSEAERFIDRFSKYYTPAVLVIALIVYLITKNVELAITMLVLGCPGALVIGVPVSHVAGIGNGASHGILLKGSEVIRDLSRIDTIIFDKTGTLTIGDPSVSHLESYTGNKQEALSILASIESESDHPLAKAILREIGEIDYKVVSQTQVIKGGGIVATIDEKKVVVGNVAIMNDQGVELTKQQKADVNSLEMAGNSIVLMAVENEVQLLLGIKDQIRENAKKDLQTLKNLGAKNLVMLSGDNQGTVDVISKELGLHQAHGNMLPQDKANYVKNLIAQNQVVAFVGDGVNDSPSIALANVGIAMGGGTDVAIETSDVVLMNSNLNHLTHALGLAKAINRNMIQNIVIAVGVVLILLASVLFSEWMNMSIGMLVHEGSILAVIINGMRLIRYRLKT